MRKILTTLAAALVIAAAFIAAPTAMAKDLKVKARTPITLVTNCRGQLKGITVTWDVTTPNCTAKFSTADIAAAAVGPDGIGYIRSYGGVCGKGNPGMTPYKKQGSSLIIHPNRKKCGVGGAAQKVAKIKKLFKKKSVKAKAVAAAAEAPVPTKKGKRLKNAACGCYVAQMNIYGNVYQ